MLLAIADFADDDGVAYPAVGTLAEKCRMQLRNAQVLLAALRQSGELEVRENEGPRGTNLYRITLAEGVQAFAGVQRNAGVQRLARRGAKACAKPLQGLAPEPSLNRQEPSDTSVAAQPRRQRKAADSVPACPSQAIVDLYHEVLPELPRVRLMTKDRKHSIPKVWAWVLTSAKSDGSRRATTAAEALEWIRSYFGRARDNDFLMGRTQRGAGHEGWQCDLDFLLTERGMKQVIEKTAEAVA
ncbi:MAG: hypothetical protein JO006_03495 [Paucibacter sp.]|nr:hypothetical protein [Roseateles sp.]